MEEMENYEVTACDIKWLIDRMREVQFGEIGIVYTIHDGRIKKRDKVDKERVEK